MLAQLLEVRGRDGVGKDAGVAGQAERGSLRGGVEVAGLEVEDGGDLLVGDAEALSRGGGVGLAVAAAGRDAGDEGAELLEAEIDGAGAESGEDERAEGALDLRAGGPASYG